MAVVDGYPEGTHKLETTLGGEPLEDGRQVSDHAIARQEKLTLTGWVSDFNGGDRPRAAWEEVRRLQKAAATFDVVTEWGTYRSMIIRRAEAPQRSRGLRFTIELEEVIIIGAPAAELPGGRIGDSGGRRREGIGRRASGRARRIRGPRGGVARDRRQSRVHSRANHRQRGARGRRARGRARGSGIARRRDGPHCLFPRPGPCRSRTLAGRWTRRRCRPGPPRRWPRGWRKCIRDASGAASTLRSLNARTNQVQSVIGDATRI